MATRNKGGRPPVEINLEEVEKLGAMGCTQGELAAWFRVSRRTIESRLAKDKAFREALDRGAGLGKISVRRMQLQLLEKGNATMAIWLGKQWLGQKDKHELGGPDGGPIDHSIKVEYVDPPAFEPLAPVVDSGSADVRTDEEE